MEVTLDERENDQPQAIAVPTAEFNVLAASVSDSPNVTSDNVIAIEDITDLPHVAPALANLQGAFSLSIPIKDRVLLEIAHVLKDKVWTMFLKLCFCRKVN